MTENAFDSSKSDSQPPTDRHEEVPRTGLATPEEAARFLRTTSRKLGNDRYRGVGVPFLRFNRKVLYRWEDIHGYCEANLWRRTDEPAPVPRRGVSTKSKRD